MAAAVALSASGGGARVAVALRGARTGATMGLLLGVGGR
jgi:hypothetical protein